MSIWLTDKIFSLYPKIICKLLLGFDHFNKIPIFPGILLLNVKFIGDQNRITEFLI